MKLTSKQAPLLSEVHKIEEIAFHVEHERSEDNGTKSSELGEWGRNQKETNPFEALATKYPTTSGTAFPRHLDLTRAIDPWDSGYDLESQQSSRYTRECLTVFRARTYDTMFREATIIKIAIY